MHSFQQERMSSSSRQSTASLIGQPLCLLTAYTKIQKKTKKGGEGQDTGQNRLPKCTPTKVCVTSKRKQEKPLSNKKKAMQQQNNAAQAIKTGQSK